MRMIGRLVTLVVVVAVARTAHAQPTSAETDEAEQLFDEARALLKNQQYAQACEKFARSFAVGHVIGAELNLGDCAERDGRLAAAWRLFDAAARDWEREGDDDRSRHARASADRVATKLATIDISAIESPAPGSTRPRSEPAPRAPSRSLVAPLALGAGAIALAGAALGLWRSGAHAYDKATAEFDNARQTELFDDANLRYHAAQGLGVASVACAGAAIWLYVRQRDEEPSAISGTARLTVAPLLASDRTGLLLEGRY